MMKKFLNFTLCIVLVFMLSACSSNNQSASSTSANNNNSTTGIFDPVAKEDLKIGVLYIGDPAEGSGYTFTHDKGIQNMKKTVGLSDSQVICKTNVSDSDPSAIESAMIECIEEGCKIIIGQNKGE